ncbi:Helicase associated domain protein [Streptomyces sp. NPDC051976]|uniref:DEAD/DEAH box helicase n=1 Tax=Streptomyces sp. NPDC051976 TaxID=3154947 RepID=UPI00342DEE4E
MAGRQRLRAHQVEAVDAVVRALGGLAGPEVPEGGMRAQVVAATGSGKSLVAVHAAQQLRAGRVLVLVPTLDLLAQMLDMWRASWRGGLMFGVCSQREGTGLGVRCSTDAGELAEWLKDADRCTVFATYAAVGLGVVERAHAAGVDRWDLVVVDEAHRTSGALGKPWAAVHDDRRVPALRRLYMTATPRLWEVSAEEAADGGGSRDARLVASMDDEAVFGPVVYRLTMSQAIERGLIAQYQVVCVDITDPRVQAAQLLGEQARTDAVRGVRLAALQTAVLKTGAEHRLRRILTFHHRTSEAEAFASGLGRVAKALWESDQEVYAEPGLVWADWLCGEHKTVHRRQVLEEFSSGIVDETVMEHGVLSSARVLGEGVDTKNCDAVVFADVRGSTPDVVQAVGRALRMQPGEGKTASLVVPVFLGPGEEPDEMLVSRAYTDLAKVLTALRAHDTEAVEQLAVPQAPSRPSAGGTAMAADGEGGVSGPAQGLLTFSTPRDPVRLAAFISARVLKPEGEYWRRGLQAALAYYEDHGHLNVPIGHTAPDGFPLGAWIGRQRHAHQRGDLTEERVRQLDELSMIWSHHAVAFDEGLAAACGWAAEHGHLLPPTEATWQGYPLGIWLKNQRAAARRPAQSQKEERADGAAAGALSAERRQKLDDIDPAWCPVWPIAWQRCFHLARTHLAGGGFLPEEDGLLIVQGEDIGRWARVQRAEWDTLTPPQQWLLTEILGVGPLDEPEPAAVRTPVPRRSRAEMWADNLTAARQYAQREGHLNVPRSHIENIGGTEHALGVFIANSRARKSNLASERVEELTAIGMRWS